MPYTCVELTPQTAAVELERLFGEAVEESDTTKRIAKVGFSAVDYFRYIDRADSAIGTPIYIVASDETGGAVGFTRIVMERSVPGYNALPGDRPCVRLDEIYVRRQARGRGVFALLIHRVRMVARRRKAVHVYCRVTSHGFGRKIASYGMRPLQLFAGELKYLQLPYPNEVFDERDYKVTELTERPAGVKAPRVRDRNWRYNAGAAVEIVHREKKK